MTILIYIYLISVLLAFLSSLISFRLDMAIHFKVFSSLLGLTFAVEATASILLMEGHSNQRLYNGFTLVEFMVYTWFFLQIIKSPVMKLLIKLFLIAFPIFWGVTVFWIFGYDKWNSYVLIVGSFFTIIFVLIYYYERITSVEIQSLRRLPEFWIATGMLVFYLGALPYFGMLNFLVRFHMAAAKSLLNVLQVLDTAMYLLFSFAYLCQIANTKK